MTEQAKAIASKEKWDINDLLAIMGLLRGEGGCPWDHEQTHKSIRNNFIEEVYEAVEGIDKDDMTILREELGDVLLQVVFHSRICEEDGQFDFTDVCSDVCAKLILRHPHVFGEVSVADSAQVLVNWEKIKQQSKSMETMSEVLDGVSKSLPALMRAQKLSKKAAKAGEYALPDEKAGQDEIGKRLFELAALAQANGIDAEEALTRYSDAFIDDRR